MRSFYNLCPSSDTAKLPFNVPKCKVFPHLKFHFNDTKSIVSVLNFLHLELLSISVQIHCTPKKPYLGVSLYY
jgi:hypothetical protein